MDGIEVEAYGHLFDQFWSPATNHRDRRVRRQLREPHALPAGGAARDPQRVGPDFVVGVRMAVDETLPTASTPPPARHPAAARPSRPDRLRQRHPRQHRQRRGAQRRDPDPRHGRPHRTSTSPAWCASAPAGRVPRRQDRRRGDGPARVREGKVDMIGMTRAHIADPHLVRKIELGKSREHTIRPCVGATYCLDRIYMAGEALCIHNAATGREQTMPHVIEPGRTAPKTWWSSAPVRPGWRPRASRRARPSGDRARGDAVGGGQLRLAAQPAPHATCSASSTGGWRARTAGRRVRYDSFADADSIDARRARRGDHRHRRPAAYRGAAVGQRHVDLDLGHHLGRRVARGPTC
jgi:hypothetical protein